MNLFSFHIALIPLGKVWIQWIVGHTVLFNLDMATSLGEGNWIQTSYRLEKVWPLLGFSYPGHATRVALRHQNQVNKIKATRVRTLKEAVYVSLYINISSKRRCECDHGLYCPDSFWCMHQNVVAWISFLWRYNHGNESPVITEDSNYALI